METLQFLLASVMIAVIILAVRTALRGLKVYRQMK
jgi:Tfp pilus assembly major pilin PilA